MVSTYEFLLKIFGVGVKALLFLFLLLNFFPVKAQAHTVEARKLQKGPVIPTSLARLLRTGDIIFQRSGSRQRLALEEATGSIWTHMGVVFKHNGNWVVYEAVQPVRRTNLEKFILRGYKDSFALMRIKEKFKNENKLNFEKLQIHMRDQYFGKPYDIYFEWADDRIYCSEYVWKAINDQFGAVVGEKQVFGDLNLNGPYMRQLIRERLDNTGRPLKLDEPVITPISMFRSEALEMVYLKE